MVCRYVNVTNIIGNTGLVTTDCYFHIYIIKDDNFNNGKISIFFVSRGTQNNAGDSSIGMSADWLTDINIQQNFAEYAINNEDGEEVYVESFLHQGFYNSIKPFLGEFDANSAYIINRDTDSSAESLIHQYIAEEGMFVPGNVAFYEFNFGDNHKGTDYSSKIPNLIDLYKIFNAAGYDCFFTGHSLGAGIATMLSTELIFWKKIGDIQREPTVDASMARLFSYGSPRTNGCNLRQLYKQCIETQGLIAHRFTNYWIRKKACCWINIFGSDIPCCCVRVVHYFDMVIRLLPRTVPGINLWGEEYDYFGDECRWEQEIDGEVKLKIIRREDEKADLLDTILALIEISTNATLHDMDLYQDRTHACYYYAHQVNHVFRNYRIGPSGQRYNNDYNRQDIHYLHNHSECKS